MAEEAHQSDQAVPEQGFGCMGLSCCYTSAKKTTPAQARAVVGHAFASGVRLFNSATFYGELNQAGYGANLRLLRHCLEGLDRAKIQIMVKIGLDTRLDPLSEGNPPGRGMLILCRWLCWASGALWRRQAQDSSFAATPRASGRTLSLLCSSWAQTTSTSSSCAVCPKTCPSRKVYAP